MHGNPPETIKARVHPCSTFTARRRTRPDQASILSRGATPAERRPVRWLPLLIAVAVFLEVAGRSSAQTVPVAPGVPTVSVSGRRDERAHGHLDSAHRHWQLGDQRVRPALHRDGCHRGREGGRRQLDGRRGGVDLGRPLVRAHGTGRRHRVRRADARRQRRWRRRVVGHGDRHDDGPQRHDLGRHDPGAGLPCAWTHRPGRRQRRVPDRAHRERRPLGLHHRRSRHQRRTARCVRHRARIQRRRVHPAQRPELLDPGATLPRGRTTSGSAASWSTSRARTRCTPRP